jgi:UDP-N-acetylglucosamine--N-acetylmuramyl-(pentapeptide) pyrophosphoryl-undecaprenol N-acetylglucosamine transferase
VTGRVVIAGGGTAGHVFPGLSLARVLAERGHQVAFLGTERGMESRLVPEAGFEFRSVPAEPFVRAVSPRALRGPAVAVRAVGRSRPVIRGASAVVGMGGYVSVPAGLAAMRERIPLVLHEQNAVPGLANRTLAHMSRAVGLGFPEAASRFAARVRCVVVGNPVRETILRVPIDREALAKEGRHELELEDTRRTVVVFGGSLGALRLNRAAVGACSLLADRGDLQLVLLTGPSHLDEVRQALPAAAAIVVRAIPFLDRMDLAYAVADLVVSRAGAGTIAELSVCGLPGVLVPYPHGVAGEQEANARSMERAGAADVMLDDGVSAERLATMIEGLIDDSERLRAMAAASAGFGRPDAAFRLADLVEEVAA